MASRSRAGSDTASLCSRPLLGSSRRSAQMRMRPPIVQWSALVRSMRNSSADTSTARDVGDQRAVGPCSVHHGDHGRCGCGRRRRRRHHRFLTGAARISVAVRNDGRGSGPTHASTSWARKSEDGAARPRHLDAGAGATKGPAPLRVRGLGSCHRGGSAEHKSRKPILHGFGRAHGLETRTTWRARTGGTPVPHSSPAGHGLEARAASWAARAGPTAPSSTARI